MARAAALLQWQSVDVGRLICRLRPVGHGERISAASCDNRTRGRTLRGRRFSDARKYFRYVPHAVAHHDERPPLARGGIWRPFLLGLEEPRVAPGRGALPGI